MARKVPSDGIFAETEQPDIDPQRMAQMISRGEVEGPVAIPDSYGAPPDETPVRHPMRRPMAHKPIGEIVDDFLRAIDGHPDAKMLSSTIAETADESQAQMFPDSPPRSLKVDTIRLIRRDAGYGVLPAKSGNKYLDMYKAMWPNPKAAEAAGV